VKQSLISIVAQLLLFLVVQDTGAQASFSGYGFIPDENGTNLDVPKPTRVIGDNTSAPTNIIKDCAECPEMVVIPSGTFMMGSTGMTEPSYDERPQHIVRINSFAMGKFEVTQGQWLMLMESNPSGTIGANVPVENVSWDLVQQFILKLNQKTLRRYRLPSESEWEYAARAGSSTEWSFGDDASKLSDYAWHKGNAKESQEVGQKLPNAFGLFDMSGNVWEMVQDCWHHSYKSKYLFGDAPQDGSAWTSSCDLQDRVLRGGSWVNDSISSRSAYRFRRYPGNRKIIIGFRLARDL